MAEKRRKLKLKDPIFATTDIVCVEVKTPPAKRTYRNGDEHLIVKLLAFMVDEDIMPVIPNTTVSAPAYYRGYHSKDHAKKIKSWLLENDVREVYDTIQND